MNRQTVKGRNFSASAGIDLDHIGKGKKLVSDPKANPLADTQHDCPADSVPLLRLL